MCFQESKRRKINFTTALIICLLTSPLLGYFYITSRPLRISRGCRHCGNTKNEAEFCGLCFKNREGKTKEELIKTS